MMSFLAAIILSLAFGTEGLEAPVVATEEGRVRGIQELSTKGRNFYSYYSIPFAKPPVGELRFKDPVPASSWDGILEGNSPPPLCLQLQFMFFLNENMTVLGQEDCLYLNVFTHKLNDKGDLAPVLVYIHGGAFYAGSASQYPPHVLMNEDIVLVTIQYRLGILGFLSTEDDLMPGNFGLKDQTEALRWVQRNVLHFGGDPSRVTIFGESAGAASVHFQMLTPKAEGLFARAIMQSGSALCPWAFGGTHREVAVKTANSVNCPTQPGPEMVTCLQDAPGHMLISAFADTFEWAFLPLQFVPRADGDYLPDEPEVLVRDGLFAKVDFISGVTSHEGGLMGLPTYSKESLRQALLEDFYHSGPVALHFTSRDYLPLPSARTLFNYYLGGIRLEETNADDFVKMNTDRHFAVPHDLTTMLHAKNGGGLKIFRYELEYRGQHSATDNFPLNFTKHWVTHVDDLFYLFTSDRWSPITNHLDSLKLRDIFTGLWANFARNGDPTPDDSLGFTWEASSEDNLQYLSLSPNPVMKVDKRKQVREFFANIPTHQNEVLQGRYSGRQSTTAQTVDGSSSSTISPAAARDESSFSNKEADANRKDEL